MFSTHPFVAGGYLAYYERILRNDPTPEYPGDQEVRSTASEPKVGLSKMGAGLPTGYKDEKAED